MTFAPDGRLFYNERHSGNVRIVTSGGELKEAPFGGLIWTRWSRTTVWWMTAAWTIAISPDGMIDHSNDRETRGLVPEP